MGAQLGEALGIEPEVMPRSAPLFVHQAGGLQHLKMLGNGGAADGKLVCEFADGGRPLSQQIEYGVPGRIGEGGQKLP